jgi:hypothetical protein
MKTHPATTIHASRWVWCRFHRTKGKGWVPGSLSTTNMVPIKKQWYLWPRLSLLHGNNAKLGIKTKLIFFLITGALWCQRIAPDFSARRNIGWIKGHLKAATPETVMRRSRIMMTCRIKSTRNTERQRVRLLILSALLTIWMGPRMLRFTSFQCMFQSKKCRERQ